MTIQNLLTRVAPQKGSMLLGMMSEVSLVTCFLLVRLNTGTRRHWSVEDPD